MGIFSKLLQDATNIGEKSFVLTWSDVNICNGIKVNSIDVPRFHTGLINSFIFFWRITLFDGDVQFKCDRIGNDENLLEFGPWKYY